MADPIQFKSGLSAIGAAAVPLSDYRVSVYTVPTDAPESDGTYEWHRTTIVIVEVFAGGERGLGYTYADKPTGALATDLLRKLKPTINALSPPAAYEDLWRNVRNLGRPGICSMAISAIDTALWDLKARLLGTPLATLLGIVKATVPVYGSGGFTSYSNKQLVDQFSGWANQGIRDVKMKIGRDASADRERVRVAREAIGPKVGLFVDANGAYARKQALDQADYFAQFGVAWFEEPVSSDDLAGLRLIRDRAPARMEIAAGEYGYDIFYFRRMLASGSVDVQQADATRCGGITGFLAVDALCQAYNISLSAHTAPALHTHVGCTTPSLRNIEYFHDHVRIERMFFDGLPNLVGGELQPDLSRPGNGLILKRSDIEKYAA